MIPAQIKNFVQSGNIRAIVNNLFENNSGIPSLRLGYSYEGQLWDFKEQLPAFGKPHENAWSEVARHVLGFHNAEGGIIFFGISDNFRFVGCKNMCDSARFNNAIRKYVGDLFHVVFERSYIQSDQRYLGVALVPPRGPRLVRFSSDSPEKSNGLRNFRRGDLAVREGDSTKTYRGPEADTYASRLSLPRVGQGYFVDDENYRILSPEYRSFVYRSKLCSQIMEGLEDPRVATVSIHGIGGVGKTSLATWAVLETYRSRSFTFIVSMTAKDRELQEKSIVPLEQPLTSYEEMIDTIIRVLRLDNEVFETFAEKESFVKEVLQDSNGLLYIDNLETVDDERIIQFLDKLPIGLRAVVTSRTPRVRRSVYPVDVGPLENHEILSFVDAMTNEAKYEYLVRMSEPDRLRFGESCNGIPLAMRWIAARCKNAPEALNKAKDINSDSTTSEQLLEFSFRRIFTLLSDKEKTLLKVLSIFRRPLTTEALHIAANLTFQETGDSLEALKEISLVEVLYDDELNASVYTLLPITGSFVYREVKKEKNYEDAIRNRMRDWLDAKDERDPVRRAIARGLRQGLQSSEETLLSLAKSALQKRNNADAEQLYNEAVKRFPKSWKANKELAEYLRHHGGEKGRAIQHYKIAATYAPKADKITSAIIYRELGILLRGSGEVDALTTSINALEKAYEFNPKDAFTANILAQNYVKAGRLAEAIKILQLFTQVDDLYTRERILKTLLECHQASGDIVEAAIVRQNLSNLWKN